MDPISPPSMPDDANHGRTRSAPRDSLMLLAILRRPDHPDLTVRIRNLSSGGLMAATQGRFLRDESVEVELRGVGLITGRVAWTAPGKVGISFDRPIDPKAARRPIAPVAAAPIVQRPAATLWRPGLR